MFVEKGKNWKCFLSTGVYMTTPEFTRADELSELEAIMAELDEEYSESEHVRLDDCHAEPQYVAKKKLEEFGNDADEACSDKLSGGTPVEDVIIAPVKGKLIKKDQSITKFTLTINNYEPGWEQCFRDLTGVAYLIAGREIAPETKTPHLQCYVRFTKGKTFAYMKKRFPKAHIERAHAGDHKNTEYCSKEDKTPFVLGTPGVGAGKRTDIERVRMAIKEGKGMRAMINEDICTSYQSLRVAEVALQYFEPKRDWTEDFNVRWYYGPTEFCKSYVAKKDVAEMDSYFHACDAKWWPGYDGQEAVVFDEFRDCFCPWGMLLRVLQPQEMRVEFKGGYRQLRAKTIIITSCYSPMDVYKNVTEDRQQFYRRITEIRKFVGKGLYVNQGIEMWKNGPFGHRLYDLCEPVQEPLSFTVNPVKRYVCRGVPLKEAQPIIVVSADAIEDYLSDN